MLAGMETPRPLPPAKARRASALLKASSTPPPAYGSPFSVPSRRMQRQNILGSPMTSTFQLVGWDADPSDQQLPSPPPENEDPEWINERSREELEELLTKADDIIKERENELGLASAVCKGLYQNNVALKSKHQAMVARIPVSPTRSNSSPENLSKMVLCNSNTSMASSTSDSALGLIKSPRQSFYRRHTRKVSIATADISLLEDQNAQLLEKLEKLEAEATSSDHAGRRELKRLEKEITFLRESLEKTQAKSEELEEKVQGAVVGEAWRRKKEREAKFKAMRNLGRDSGGEESPIRNFAPEGSRYGGPSNTFSFFPTAESRATEHQSVDGPPALTVDKPSNFLDPLSRPEHALISQLLVKVQELELTNARILQQQSETATQLSAVQRDTAHITKVYECLTDPNSTELHFEGDDQDEEEYHDHDPSSANTIKFTSLKRDIEADTTYDGTCIVRPDFCASAGKNRKSVMGLFDDPAEDSLFSQSAHGDRDSRHDQESLWSEDPDSSTFSSNTTSRNLDLISPMPGALSPLHFFSPAPRIPSELSPINSRSTLQSELSKELGNDWEMNTNNHRIRSLSLYDLSQMSVPTSPSPISRTTTMRLADELDTDENSVLPLTPLLSSANSLRLSVEPPTPHRYEGSEQARIFMRDGRSPRMQMMSDTLRSRTNRWADRRLQRSRSGWRVGDDDFDGHYQKDSEISRPPSPLDIGIPERLSHAVDSMIQGFDTFAGVSTSTDKQSLSRPATPHGQRDESSLLLHTGTTPKKKEEATNSGFLLQVWLWLQFAIVIFVFLYAMARRGPTAMLSEEQKRAVVRRR